MRPLVNTFSQNQTPFVQSIERYLGTPCHTFDPPTLVYQLTSAYRNYRPGPISTGNIPKYGFRPPTPWFVRDGRFRIPQIDPQSFYEPGTTFVCPADGNTYPLRYKSNYQFYFTLSGLPSPTPFTEYTSYDASLNARADLALLDSIKSEGGASLGLALLERKETEHLLTTSIGRVRKSIQAVKDLRGPAEMRKVHKAYLNRARFSKLGRPLSKREISLSRVPEFWLEVQYGWKPLMSDVYDAMKAVDFHQVNNNYRFSKSVAISQTDPAVRSQTFYDGRYPADFQFKMIFDRLERVKLRCDYQIDTSGALATLASLGLTNPIDLAWERLPYSFVIDWFIPLGKWFNSFDATLGRSFIAGTRSNSIRETCTSGQLLPTGTSPGFYVLGKTVGLEYNFFQFDRYVLTGFPSPALPAFKNPCSPTHVANALSLLVGELMGGVPAGLRR